MGLKTLFLFFMDCTDSMVRVHPRCTSQRYSVTRGLFFVVFSSQNISFFFFFMEHFRLSARISDFENILLMVHVGGVHACAAGARYATFFFTNARF